MSAEQGSGTPGSGAMSDRMRALLSRAAEEQLLEQRQVSTVLGELRALVEDLDERLATGEQVERVAAEVRALSERVDAGLHAAETRDAELAERLGEATALLGQAAHDLAGVVAAQVVERVEAQLREVLAGVGETVGSSERRLATHVDDAVLALAEVVLRRRRTVVPVAAPEVQVPSDGGPVPAPAVEGAPEVAAKAAAGAAPQTPVGAGPDLEAAGAPPHEPAEAAAPAGDLPTERPPDEPTQDEPAQDEPAQDQPAQDQPTQDQPAQDDLLLAAPSAPAAEGLPRPPEAPAEPTEAADPGLSPAEDADGADRGPGAPPADGFVLVPADVEQPDAAPGPPVQHERRTADRRTADRSDGSGRRRRPWWRPA